MLLGTAWGRSHGGALSPLGCFLTGQFFTAIPWGDGRGHERCSMSS